MSIVNRPDKLPEFATQDLVDPTTGQNNVIEPIQNFKDFGWNPFGIEPPRNNMNWIHRKTYENQNYFDSRILNLNDSEKKIQDGRLGSFTSDHELGSNDRNNDGDNYDIKLSAQTGKVWSLLKNPLLGSVDSLSSFHSAEIPEFTTMSSNTVWTSDASTNGLLHTAPVVNDSWYSLFILYSSDDQSANFDKIHAVSIPIGFLPTDSGYETIKDNWTHWSLITHYYVAADRVEPHFIHRDEIVFAGETQDLGQSAETYYQGLSVRWLPIVQYNTATTTVLNQSFLGDYSVKNGTNNNFLPNTSSTPSFGYGFKMVCDLMADGVNSGDTRIQSTARGWRGTASNDEDLFMQNAYDLSPGQVIHNATIYFGENGNLKVRNLSAGGNGVNQVSVRPRTLTRITVSTG